MTEGESEGGRVRQLIHDVLSSTFRLGAIEALGNPGRSVDSVLERQGSWGICPPAPDSEWLRTAPFNSLALLVCHPHEQGRLQGLEKVRRERHAGG